MVVRKEKLKRDRPPSSDYKEQGESIVAVAAESDPPQPVKWISFKLHAHINTQIFNPKKSPIPNCSPTPYLDVQSNSKQIKTTVTGRPPLHPNSTSVSNLTGTTSSLRSLSLTLPQTPNAGTSTFNAMIELETRKLKATMADATEKYEKRIAKLKLRLGRQKAEASVRIFELEEEIAGNK